MEKSNKILELEKDISLINEILIGHIENYTSYSFSTLIEYKQSCEKQLSDIVEGGL